MLAEQELTTILQTWQRLRQHMSQLVKQRTLTHDLLLAQEFCSGRTDSNDYDKPMLEDHLLKRKTGAI